MIPSSTADDSSVLGGLDPKKAITQFKNACSDSLSACRYLEHPTLNTLVGSILLHTFKQTESSTQDALFIATTIRLAQGMGLHRENNLPDLDSTKEQRRQIWWHLVWLDIQTSLANGLPTCLADNPLDVVQMISAPDSSPTDLLAVGRYEAARLQNKLIYHFQNATSRTGGQISLQKVTELVDAGKSLGRLLDSLIARIPASQNVEDILPVNLKEASPKTHHALYQDKCKSPSVIGALARTSLLLLKLEVTIMMRKMLLGPPDSISHDVSWNRYVSFYILTEHSTFLRSWCLTIR